MNERLHDAVASRLAHVGQRYTSNRRAIVAVLLRARNPVTIPEIIARGERLATSSVYRNLTVLEDAGVVHRIVTSGEFARYELAEALTEHHHHHMICSRCGLVQDFRASPQLERSAAGALARIASRAGFAVTGHRLDVVGVCADCA